ncbi:hypothetical protein MLD38_035299 [Melastoma candidum]|uniref:Uncharacterized protein n=1 Tax=Melastoma candidum TaxID=119954 RepID=A0ACB9MD61_9MYRT|nr:hypothetical protein MLD38_035299 [Melastoma candidum]
MTSTWFPFSSGCSISTVTTPLVMCLKSSRTLNSVDETIGSLFIMKLARHALKLNQKEICDVVRWWKDGAFMGNLPFVRNRNVKSYLGIDLGRLLNLLELDLIATNDGLKAAIQEQRAASATAIGSTVGDSSPAEAVTAKEKLLDEKQESLGLQIQHIPLAVKPREADWKLLLLDTDLNLEDGPNAAGPSIEHEFIPSCSKRSPLDGIVGSTTRREMLPQTPFVWLNDVFTFSTLSLSSISFLLEATEDDRGLHSQLRQSW